MIKMISSASFNKPDSKSIPPPDSGEPEEEDFAALLNNLSFIVPPVVKAPENVVVTDNQEISADLQNFELSGEDSAQPLPQFAESIVLPKEFAEVFDKSNFSAADQIFNKQTSVDRDLLKTEQLAEITNSSEAKTETASEDLFAQIENIETNSDLSEKNFLEFKSIEKHFSIETFAAKRKDDPANKLPKLFREVSIFLESSETPKNTNNFSESATQTPAKAQSLAAQIEPQIFQMATLAFGTGKPQILKMRLNPAELGAVEIRIEKDAAGNLNAYFQTENEEARKILTENLAQLRDSLQDSGWQFERVEVSCGSFSFAGNEAREEASRAFENTVQNSSVQTADAVGAVNNKDEMNSEKSNRLLSVRA